MIVPVVLKFSLTQGKILCPHYSYATLNYF
jgi:hypothetical protein